MMPMRREDDVLVQELPDETLVYDVNRNKAHCLNRTAALVWRYCDGRTTVAEMAKILHAELSIPAEVQIVWQALDRLQRARLLSESIVSPASISRMSRRDCVRKLGVAAILVPAVMTVIAPTTAMAATQLCVNKSPGSCGGGTGCTGGTSCKTAQGGGSCVCR